MAREGGSTTLQQMLLMFVGHAQDDWDDLFPAVEFACNSAVHDSTERFIVRLEQCTAPTCSKGPRSSDEVSASCDLNHGTT